MRFGLDRMHKLMTVLETPQRRFASIHVVGTNGKSSTARFIAAILERHGLRTGSYTSPHLASFRERIEIREMTVGKVEFAEAVASAARAAALVDRTQAADDVVTQFEALTAAAYAELARQRVEVAVIEAGLGGRYDATNVIPSKVQVLTSVGLDHTRWLGPTIADVAEEKLAVVRERGMLVLGPGLHPDAERVAVRVAAERQARLVRARQARRLSLRAPGEFQRRNFGVAMAAAEAFLGHELDRPALERAASETRVPGRLDVIARDPIVIHDGAHNPAGAAALAAALPEVTEGRRPVVAVISVLEDKDAAEMLAQLLPACDQVVFTRCVNPRALSPATLESLARKLHSGADIETVAQPLEAMERAAQLAGREGVVVATGSIYLIADLVRQPGAARASTL